MAASRRGKSTIIQAFPEENVVSWQQKLQNTPREAVVLLSGVLEAATVHIQLGTLKKFGTCVQELSSDADTETLRDVVCVLVEMHATCISRHPVQRSIASILQGLPQSLHACTEDCVAATVQKVLYGKLLAEHMRKIQYLDVVVENFKIGEAALQRMIPLAMEYCVSTVDSHCCQIRRHDATILIAVLKTTANLLQKFPAVVCQMLSMEEPSKEGDSGGFMLVWPHHVSGRSTHDKMLWVKEQLAIVRNSCESVLLKAASVPHDCTVSTAMLSVVLLLHEAVNADVDERISHFSQQWLAEGSSLEHFGRLAVTYALLAKLPTLKLLVVLFHGQPLLVALFSILCQLFNSFTETSHRYIASCTLSLWTSVARDCVKDVSPTSPLYKSLLPSGGIMQSLLQYVWSLWEDPVDGIRHQCKDMFKNITETCRQLQSEGSEDFLFSLVETLLALETPTRGKFILLSSVSQYVKVDRIIQARPGLPEEILVVMGHQALACHAGDLWSLLTGLHWKLCVSKDTWYKTWVDIIIRRMCEASPLARQHMVQHCIPALFHCDSECMQYINQYLQSERIVSVSAESKLITRLACLRCAKTECKQFSTNVSFSDILSSAMHCADEQIRLSALGLVCESHRTTEPLDPSCLHLVVQFVELNANSQTPGFRYAAINSLKKLLIRIRDSSYALAKQHQKEHCETPKTYILSMQEFLQLLLNQQFEVLHPLSSFQRRNFALLVLQLLSTIFEVHLTDTTVRPMFDFANALSETQAKSLLHGLRDSYDANRVLYFDLLQKISAEKLGLMDHLFLKHLAATFFCLIESPKAVNSASAAFFIKVFLRKVCLEFNGHLKTIKKEVYKGEENAEADPDTGSSLVPWEYPQWSTIHILSGVLLQHIHIADCDLLQASMVAPMYGVIQCIRVSFEEAITLSPTSNVIGQFRSSVSEVVTLCSRVVKLVSPVVCNSSPEGFLPDAKNLDVYGHSKLLDRTVPTTGNAQSLLLCCWHSMKEISLILGFMVEHVPVQEDHGETGVLTFEQLDVFANIFINQLTEARHRGAFEMAYTGFSKLCHCLWTSSCAELHQKPSVWVQELLDSLQSTSLTRLLSVTRRSAGLPFYMQAILTSEPPNTGRCCLKTTMRTLLKIARSCNVPRQVENSSNAEVPKTPTDTQLPLSEVVHALNILRALYRDTRLGDSIAPFVAEGVMIAVEGFSSTLWPIRNSSTLLFSALVARTFGAKRVTDQHSMENKMTAKDFFTRFPSLHGFLLEQLKNACEVLERQDGNLHPSLFPVLLLLSHLYPSALDEENSPVSLQLFLPHLMRCISCPVWKTRVLISHATVSIVSAQDVHLLIEDIVKKISPHNQNELHGLLLIVYRLFIDRSGLLDVPCSSDSTMGIGHWLLELLLTKPCFSVNSCSVTATLYHELATKLLEHLFCKKDHCSLSENAVGGLTKLAQNAQKFLFANNAGRSTTFPDDEFLVSQCRLLLLVAQYSERHLSPKYQWPHTTEVISQSLQHSCQTVQLLALEYLTCNPSAVDEGVLHAVIEIVLHDNTGCDQDVLAKAFGCMATARILPSAADPHDTECSALKKVLDRAVDLSHLKYIRLVLRLALVRYVSAALSSNFSVATQYLSQWLAVLKEDSSPMHPVELRIEVARSLLQLWNVVHEALDVDMYCKLVVELLQDADCDVHEEMAVSVAAIIAQTNPQCGSSLQNPTAYSALSTFLGSLFSLFPKHKAKCFRILLDLISLDPAEPLSEGPTNPLFDEDPINNYKEEARLVQITSRCLMVFIEVHHTEVADELQQLCERVALVLQLHLQELLGCSMKLWDQPRQFLLLYKLLTLRKVLLSAPFNSPYMAIINMSVQQLKETDPTLTFQPLLSNLL